MKHTIALVFGAAMLTSAATAADMQRPVYKAPLLPAPVQTWTGFYAGINGGVAGMRGPQSSYLDHAINAYVPLTVDPSSSTTSGIVGLHLGYNYQFTNNWLLGVEGDWDWTNAKTNVTHGLLCSTLFGPRPQCGGAIALTDNASFETKIDWLASLRGRLGYTWNQWLLYITGGVAFADAHYTAQVNCTGVAPTQCAGGRAQSILTKFSDTRIGAVVGGGVEFKPARNWILGAEYLYYHFDGDSTAGGSWYYPDTGAPAAFYECGTGQNCATFTFRSFDVHTGRVRLSYQFAP